MVFNNKHNPYTKAAQNFTSRLNVQYKIQRRQLRVTHQDEHYCNAQLKYLKDYDGCSFPSNRRVVYVIWNLAL
jgi:hypothetical protein